MYFLPRVYPRTHDRVSSDQGWLPLRIHLLPTGVVPPGLETDEVLALLGGG